MSDASTSLEIPDWVQGERSDLAAILDDLSPEQWSAPSLCAGWRVQEVVAHLVMPVRVSTPRFVLEMVGALGRFNVMADRRARADAATLGPDGLRAAFEQYRSSPWKPPGGGFEGALSHDVIHGLDITTALCLDRVVPGDRIDRVLGAQTPRSVKFFGVDLDGIQLVADDRDWTYGSGAPLRGLAQDLLLVQCGRRLPAGRLRGDAADRFRA